ARRRVLFAGAAATLAGALFVFACMQWFKHQPYSIREPILPTAFPVMHVIWQFLRTSLGLPFLLLPLVALFLPEIRKSRVRTIAIISVVFLGYLFLATYPSSIRVHIPLEPTMSNWVTPIGMFESVPPVADPPIFLNTGVQILFTIVSIFGLLGLISLLFRSLLLRSRRSTSPIAPPPSPAISWHTLGVLLAPFSLVYILLLVPRATWNIILDRYMLELLVVGLICIARFYQERVQPRIPFAGILLVAIMAIYGIACTHNMFSLDRARVAIAAELHANGIPDTSIDNGWEYNLSVELQHARYINDPRLTLPAHAYVPTPRPAPDTCEMAWYAKTPHIHPLYGISFNPNVCDGPAPFAPVHYSRWLASPTGTLYVVRYTPPAKP
ncbi:MAG: hypothetical protein WB439_04230, partial [Acidobacteriaceae bacterium]